MLFADESLEGVADFQNVLMFAERKI